MIAKTAVDWASLLEPIQKKNPCGVDVRIDTTLRARYQALKDARMEARSAERRYQQGLETQNTSFPLWQQVFKTALELLKKTRDLEIAAWLMESSLRLQGFAGLRESVHCTTQWITQFGNQLSPTPDEDGLETTCAALRALDGQDTEGSLIAPIYGTVFSDEGTRGFSFADYRQAKQFSKVGDAARRAQYIKQGGLSVEACLEAWQKQSAAQQKALKADLADSIIAYQQLDQTLENFAPGLVSHRQILAALEDCQGCLNELFQASPAIEEVAVVQALEILIVPETSTSTETQASNNHSITQRTQAITDLKKITAYFREHEPHSPLPYLLQRAIDWSALSLPELLDEWLTDDPEQRQRVRRLVGMPSREGAQ